MVSLPSAVSDYQSTVRLVYAKSTIGYQWYRFIVTNTEQVATHAQDESFECLKQVKESCWPIAQTDGAGEWKVPNGLYEITATVKDYAGSAKSASVLVALERGSPPPPAQGKDTAPR